MLFTPLHAAVELFFCNKARSLSCIFELPLSAVFNSCFNKKGYYKYKKIFNPLMLRDTSVHQTTFAPKLPQLSIHTKTQVEINSGVIGLNFGLWHDMLHSIWCMTPPPFLCQNFWDLAGIAPAGDCSGDLCLRRHLGISCMPPTAWNSPCSNRPPANYGFPRSMSSWNHHRISQWYEMFSFAPSSLV